MSKRLHAGHWLLPASLLLTACASAPITHEMAHDRLQKQVDEALHSENHVRMVPNVVDSVNKPYIRASEMAYRRDDGDVTLHEKNVSAMGLLHALAETYGYSVMMKVAPDTGGTITIDLAHATPEDALRMVAGMAGVIAIIDPSRRTVEVASAATQTYKIPTNLLQQLQTRFSVGGNPTAASAEAGKGANGMLANFQVQGQLANNVDAIAAVLHRVAGQNADVQIVPELGIIHIHANAAELGRLHDFLKQFCQDAMSQVEIQASIIEVTLGDDLKYGINWSKILGGGTRQFSVNTSDFSPTDAAYTATVTTATTMSIVKALQEKTDVNIITQPYVIAMNHTPSVLFDGSQMPYLGNLKSTVGTTVNPAMTVDAQTQFAVDGISLSIQPDILNNREVQISIVPVLSSIKDYSTFNVDGATLQVPSQQIRQSYMKVLARSGQTIILGGSRYSNASKKRQGLPGVMDMPVAGQLTSGETKSAQEKELIILMSTRIVPAPPYDPLVSEAP